MGSRKQDNDIIWLMADRMVSKINTQGLLHLEIWAEASDRNRIIYDRFIRAMELNEAKGLDNWGTPASWIKFEKAYFDDNLTIGAKVKSKLQEMLDHFCFWKK